jgi:hypothetical protein
MKICHTTQKFAGYFSEGVEKFFVLRNEIILLLEVKEQDVCDI